MSSFFTPPEDVATLHAEAFFQATCYSLPYGAVGFASHLITYYTLIMLFMGRNPLWPWRRLQYPTISGIIAIIHFIVSIVLASISISKCHSEKAFTLMGAWMMMTSVAVSLTMVAAPYAFGTTEEELEAEKVMMETIKRERKSFDLIGYARMEARGDRKFPVPGVKVQLYVEDPARKNKREMGKLILFWVGIIWVAGSIMGVYGVILFGNGRWTAISALNTVMVVFALVVFFPTIVAIFKLKNMSSDTFGMLFVTQLVLVCSLGLLWMDWTVGAMTDNLVGVPGRRGGGTQLGQILAWVFFVSERLPLLAV